MPAKLTQLFESEKVTYSADLSRVTSAVIYYKVMDVASEAAALVAAVEKLPETAHDLGLRNIEISDRLGTSGWRVAATYGEGHSSATAEIISYSNVMRSTRCYNSKATVNRFWTSAVSEPVNFNGLIDVQDGEAQGADVYFPVSTMNIAHFFSNDQFSTDFRNRLVKQPPVMNSAEFRGFAPGELLFGGVYFTLQRINERKYWRADFTFLISPNDADVQIAGWTGPAISKWGWDLLWLAYKNTVSNNVTVQIPYQAQTERVYYSMDFTRFGLSARG